MANIREMRDSGSEPGYPTIEEMRESQADGAQGSGTQPCSYSESLADFNMEPGSPSTVDDDTSSPSPDVEPRSWMP